MRVLVIGAGLIGVTTAYCLSRRGYQVTVIERQSGPGMETSFANGALLHPSMPEPWNSPGCGGVLLKSLVRSDTALKLRLKALPGMIRWGTTFLRNSRIEVFERSVRSNLRLARYSLEVMHALRDEFEIDYGRAARGSLRVFRDAAACDRAARIAESRDKEGIRFRKLTSNETIDLEPSLAAVAERLTGSIHYLDDEIGDAHRFCHALAERAQDIGVKFCFSSSITSLEVRNGRAVAASNEGQRWMADQLIVACGSYSPQLLAPLGIRLPIQPAKGYSVTLPASVLQPTLGVPVIDDQLHAAIVPLKGAIRVAGTAEFAGYDLTARPERIRNLLSLLHAVLPRASFHPSQARAWCGLRPMSADGVPIIGATPMRNLLVNTGHGHLGWTMAAGSAQLLADLVSGDRPSIDPTPFALGRFL